MSPFGDGVRVGTSQDPGFPEHFTIDIHAPGYSDTVQQILSSQLPDALRLFLNKNQGYGDMADVLGSRAQFVDIHRKVDKLKRALWERENIGEESPMEVLRDLFGHVLLAMRTLSNEYEEATRRALEEEKRAH